MPKLQVKRSFFGHFLFLGNHHFQQWVGSIIISLCGSHPTQLPKTQAQTKHGACPCALPLLTVSHPRQTYFPNANASPGNVCYFFFFYSFEYFLGWDSRVLRPLERKGRNPGSLSWTTVVDFCLCPAPCSIYFIFWFLMLCSKVTRVSWSARALIRPVKVCLHASSMKQSKATAGW